MELGELGYALQQEQGQEDAVVLAQTVEGEGDRKL
jgi:hypothetical protein